MVMYITSPYSIKVSKRKLVSIITWSIIPAFVLHFFGIIIAENCLDYDIKLEVIGFLLSSRTTEPTLIKSYTLIEESLSNIFLYHFVLIITGIFTGRVARKIIRGLKWDRTYRFFRFSNKFHYIFSGESLDFPDVQDSFDDITVRVLHLLCNVGNNQPLLYAGYFQDYYLDSTGSLESVIIKDPFKKVFEENVSKEQWTEIPSRYLYIDAKSILNVNMLYLNIDYGNDNNEETFGNEEVEIDYISSHKFPLRRGRGVRRMGYKSKGTKH